MPAAAKKIETIGAALAAVTADISSMEKTARNKFGGYDYVPVDDVYAEVRKALAKNGVTLIQSQQGCENFTAPTGKGGNEEVWVRCSFTYTYYWESSEAPGGSNFVDVRMASGSQGAGAAASYALKSILRSNHVIPMGDYDIDSGALDEKAASAPAAKKEAPKKEAPKNEAAKVEELSEDAAYDLFHNLCEDMFLRESVDDLVKLMKANQSSIDKLPKKWKDSIVETFKEVKEKLESGNH